jgi:hypothetical protein
MQRLSIALLVVIMVLAGFAARMAFDRPVASGPMGVPADVETAHAFYRALNEALASSNTNEMSALLAGYFVEHEVGFGEMQSADAFLARLQTIARSSPGVRLEVDSIDVMGTSLIVAVHQTRASSIEVAGLAIEEPVDERSYDVLRIERGKVADRWTSGIDCLDATTFAVANIALRTSGMMGIDPVLHRIFLPAGTQLSWESSVQALLFVESGSVRMSAT